MNEINNGLKNEECNDIGDKERINNLGISNKINKTKICPRCKIELELNSNNFYRCSTRYGGFNCYCKKCFANPPIPKENIDKPKYRKCNDCKKILEFTNEFFSKNKALMWKLGGICKKCSSKRATNYGKKSENKKRRNIRRNKQRKYEREHNESFRIQDNFGKKVRKAIKSRNSTKLAPTTDLLGCSYDDFLNI